MTYSAAASLLSGHVLIVDDEPFGLERLAAALRRLGGPGMVITTAGTFDGAIDTCREHRGAFGLVLLNHFLWPGDLTGLDLLPELHRAGLAAEARTVLFSINMDRQLRARALAAGFDETLLSEYVDSCTLAALLGRQPSLPQRETRLG